MRIAVLCLAVIAAIPGTARAQEGSHSTKGLKPLIYWKDDGVRSEFGMLGGLITFEREPGKSYSAVLPLFSIERDQPLRLFDLYIIWPLIRYKEQGDETRFHILPLLWHSRDADSGSTVLLPLFYSFWDTEQKEGGARKRWFETFLPLYWRFGREGGNEYFHIWPFFGHHKRPRDKYDSYFFLAPFFRYFRDRQNQTIGYDYPLFLGGFRKSPDSYTFWYFPLTYLHRSPDESATIITPLFGYLTDRHGSSLWAIPFYIGSDRGNYRLRAFLLNLLVLQRDNHYRSLGVLWPLIGLRDEGQRKSMHLFPLLWGSAGEDRHSLLFLPLLYSRSTPKESDLVIFPLLWHHRRGLGEDERWTTFGFPLFYDSGDASSRFTMLLPFFGSWRTGEDHARYIFPTIFDMKQGDSSYFHAWPFYGHHRVGEDYDRYFFLAPFFSYTSDREKKEWAVDFLWPLWHYRRGEDSESLRLLPLAWYDRDLSGTSMVIFPFYWRSKDEESSYFFIPPFYGEQRRGDSFLRQIFLGGAYVRTRDDDKDLSRHDVLYPLFTRKKEGEETLTALRPLFWHESSPERSRTILLPLFYRQVEEERSLFLSLLYSRGIEKGRSRWDNVLGLLYHRYSDGKRTSQEILFPLIHTSSGPDESTLEIRPLFWRSRQGESGHTLLLPLYYHQWGPDQDALNIFPFFTRVRRPDGSTTTSVLGPVYISQEKGDVQQQDILWPLLHHYRDAGVEKWQVRPLFFHSTLAGGESRTTLFPIYWRKSSQRHSYFHIWPLFGTETWTSRGNTYQTLSTAYPFFSYTWDEQGTYRRFDFLFPLFRASVKDRNATTWLFPLFFYDSDWLGNEYETDLYVLPPLFYHGTQGDITRWNILWKLVTYDRVGDRSDFRVLFELFRTRSREDSSLVRFFPLFSWKSDGESSEFNLLLKLFSYRSDAEGVEMNILHSLFRYESTDDRWLLEVNPLFSVETRPDSWYFSILGGFLSLEGKPSGTELGLLYFVKI